MTPCARLASIASCALMLLPVQVPEMQEFRYLPAVNGTVNPAEVRTVGGAPVTLKKTVGELVRGEVANAIKQAKLRIRRGLVLSGEVEELAFRAVEGGDGWILRIRYLLTDKASGTILYDGRRLTQQSMAKGLSPEALVAIATGFNVQEQLEDPAFRQALLTPP